MHLPDYLKYSKVFIETGSANGDGIKKALAAGFERVKSVELHPGLYQHCKQRFASNPNVELFFGKSEERLEEMITGPSVIFLDAHPAGPSTAGHVELMRDGTGSEFDQDTIIKKELQIILKSKGHVIIIDDCQGDNELTRYYKSLMPGYRFTFFDEGDFKDKILVCEP